MKRFLMILVMVSWCNVGFADILLKDCKLVSPVGSHTIDTDGKAVVLTEEEVEELEEDERDQFYIDFEEGAVYRARVRPGWVKHIDQERTHNTKYIITFADDKLITAIGKNVMPDAPDDSYYVILELEINLENNELEITHRGETSAGRRYIDLMKSMTGNNLEIQRCERENFEDVKGESSGTAFFINKKGHLLTNNHVVEGCKVSKINYFNKEYNTKLIATDKTLDLALLKANVSPKSFISFSKDEPKKRQAITAAGYPLGKFLSDDLKINDGRISALKGFENNSNEIQHDIAINPGNSGGPIVNENGELVAIAVSGMAKDITEGLNFGIKSSAAANFLKSNKISPSTGYMSFSTSDDKLVKLLEESTVYTFCN